MHMNAHRYYTTACNYYHNRQPPHTFAVYMCKFSVNCFRFSHIYVGQSISMAMYIYITSEDLMFLLCCAITDEVTLVYTPSTQSCWEWWSTLEGMYILCHKNMIQWKLSTTILVMFPMTITIIAFYYLSGELGCIATIYHYLFTRLISFSCIHVIS